MFKTHTQHSVSLSAQTHRGPGRLSALSLAVSSALLASATVQANSDIQTNSGNQTTTLETMTVWDASVSSSSQLLGDDSISMKQPDHLSDLLRDIPGVDVGGTHSVNQRINIRGLNEKDLDIRLDGASQFANMFHHVGNLTLNADIIKSVDIQVGANSVVNDGIGGAVYFETKTANDLLLPGDNFGGRVFAGYGSNRYHQSSITLYGKPSDQTDVLVYGFGIDRDNFKDGDGNKTFGADGKVTNGLIKLGWEPDASQRLQLSFDRYQDEGDYNPRPDMSGSANTALSSDLLIPTEYDRDTLNLQYKLDKGEHFNLDASLYRNHIDLMRDESIIESRWPSDRISVNTAENINTGARVMAQSELDAGGLSHSLTYGFDLNEQVSKSQYGSGEGMEETMTRTALFVENRMQLTDTFSVTPGVRFNHAERDAETGDHDFDGVTWALASEWEAHDNVTLFASTRQLFKAPELLETFIKYQDVAILADNIKEETGQNSEIGARFSMKQGDHRFESSLTLFRTDIKDYIVKQFNSDRWGYDIVNDGDVRLQGFELSGLYSHNDFSARLSYSRSDADNRTNNTPLLDGNSRSVDIGDSISLNLDYSLYDINAELGWNSIWVMEEDNVKEGADKKPSYDVHSVYVQWAPQQVEGLLVTAGIDNLFDEQYVSHASRTGSNARAGDMSDAEPGRNVKVSLAYQF